jgi:hypothetical protein
MFQKVDKEGLCKSCGPTVSSDIEKHTEEIYEAMHVFERAPAEEKLEHCDRVIGAAESLLKYEQKGLETCSPPARIVVDEYKGFREEWAAK